MYIMMPLNNSLDIFMVLFLPNSVAINAPQIVVVK